MQRESGDRENKELTKKGQGIEQAADIAEPVQHTVSLAVVDVAIRAHVDLNAGVLVE